jgi:hypothetical protein
MLMTNVAIEKSSRNLAPVSCILQYPSPTSICGEEKCSMPRFKPIDRGMKLLPIDLSVQLLPGTFEHALSHLIDYELDLRGFDERFHNDESGARAYVPSVLLTVILYAHSLVSIGANCSSRLP